MSTDAGPQEYQMEAATQCLAPVEHRDTYRRDGRSKRGFRLHYVTRRCTRRPVPGSLYCWQHGGRWGSTADDLAYHSHARHDRNYECTDQSVKRLRAKKQASGVHSRP